VPGRPARRVDVTKHIQCVVDMAAPQAGAPELFFRRAQLEWPLDAAARRDHSLAANEVQARFEKRHCRLERKPERPRVPKGQVVVLRDEEPTRLGVQPLGERLANRMYSAAGAVARLDHHDVVPSAAQFVSRCEPRQSGAQHDDFTRCCGA